MLEALSRQHPPRTFRLPSGSVDCHAHVIGDSELYPFVADRSYTPDAASPDLYMGVLDATQLEFGVLVQPSVHGFDNSFMLGALRANRTRLRGIAVLQNSLTDSEYSDVKRDGVVGLRLNTLYGGGADLEQLRSYGALAKELGWHLELLVNVHDLPTLAPTLDTLDVPFVIDHMGHFPVELGSSFPGFQSLVGLVRDGGWVKLSAAYRFCEYPYRESSGFAQTLFAAAPSRCLWGSDWPHVAHAKQTPAVADLLDGFASWFPQSDQRQAILVANPKALFRFP